MIDMDYKQAIDVIKSNYPSSNYTMLREALDLAIDVLEDKNKQETHSASKGEHNGRGKQLDELSGSNAGAVLRGITQTHLY